MRSKNFNKNTGWIMSESAEATGNSRALVSME
jgi:hypothetical protein